MHDCVFYADLVSNFPLNYYESNVLLYSLVDLFCPTCLPILGTYQSESGKGVCRNCPQGSYNNEKGASSCSPCPVGRAIDIEKASECDFCPKGRYQSASGAVDCVNCSAGRFQKREQMAFCDACAEGYWSNLGWSRCLMCAEGYWYRSYYEAVATFAALDNATDSQFTNDNDIGFLDDGDDAREDDGGVLSGKNGPGCVSCGVPKITGAYCGGGLCLPVPQRGFWSQGVDSSSDDFNIVGSYIYVCRSKGCTGAPTLDEGCYSDWHIESYPDLTRERRRRLNQEMIWASGSTDLVLQEELQSAVETSIGRTLLAANDTTNVTVYDGIGRTVVSEPTDKANICSPGAWGPLCQACEDGWFFDAAKEITCQKCESSSILASLPSFMAMIGLVMLIRYRGVIPLPAAVKKVLRLKRDPQVPFVAALSMIPPGQLKVIWSTIQIVQAVGTHLELSFPEPMLAFNLGTSVLNLDFLSVDCSSSGANFHSNVYSTSAFPLILLSLICLAYWTERGLHAWNIRCGAIFTTKEERALRKRLYDGYVARALTTTYLFLPTVTMTQFKGMNCFSYEASSQSYLKADSSIDCKGASHQSFIVFNSILIIFYQSIILFYFYILYSNFDKINPIHKVDGDANAALRLRDLDHSIDHIRFLFNDTRVSRWYHEVFDMYRRMFFIGVLPLTSEVPVTKAYIGAGAAMAMTIYFREMLPSRNPFTNLLAVVSQYQILFVLLAALFILTAAIDKVNVSDLALGCLLVFANIIVIVGAIYAGWLAHLSEIKRITRRKRKVTEIEYAALFDDEKFETTLECINETSVSQASVLVYHYTSMAAANLYVKNGIPVYSMNYHKCWSSGRVDECRGVVFSLKGPHELKHGDPCLEKMSPLSACREAVLCVAVPRELLWPVIERSLYDDEDSAFADNIEPDEEGEEVHLIKTRAARIEALSHLVVIPCEALTAFSRCGLDKEEVTTLVKGWGIAANRHKKPAAKARAHNKEASFNAPKGEYSDYMIAAEEGALAEIKEKTSPPGHGTKGESDEQATIDDLHAEDTDEHARRGNYMHGMASKENDEEAKQSQQAEFILGDDSLREDDDEVPEYPPLVVSSQSILRAYQLTPDVELDANQVVTMTDLVCPEVLCDLAHFTSQFDPPKETKFTKRSSLKEHTPSAIQTCEEYLGRMAEVRDECDKLGLIPIYYYTTSSAAGLIARNGFPFMTASSKDSGIYFTALSPASYDVGSFEYEDNLILDMLGPDSLMDSHRAHKFDVCIAYAAEPRVMRQAPGRHGTVKMVPKLFLEHFSEPEPRSGDFLLRPDRIVACFLLDPSNRLTGYDSSSAALTAEKEEDNRSINELGLMEAVSRFNDSMTKGEHGLSEGQDPWPRMDMVLEESEDVNNDVNNDVDNDVEDVGVLVDSFDFGDDDVEVNCSVTGVDVVSWSGRTSYDMSESESDLNEISSPVESLGYSTDAESVAGSFAGKVTDLLKKAVDERKKKKLHRLEKKKARKQLYKMSVQFEEEERQRAKEKEMIGNEVKRQLAEIKAKREAKLQMIREGEF